MTKPVDIREGRVQVLGFAPSDFRHKIIYDGRLVPYVRARHLGGDKWEVMLDGRISYEFTRAALLQAIPLLADAMAVSAGYGCAGVSERMNPHNVAMHGVVIEEGLGDDGPEQVLREADPGEGE